MKNITFICTKKAFTKLNGWAKEISNATFHEPNLLHKTETELVTIANSERAIIALNKDKQIVGFVVLWSLGIDSIGNNWNEIGTVYVPKHYRGQGIGSKIMNYAFKRWDNHKIMSTSKNVKFIHIALKSMIPVSSEKEMLCVVPLTCICDESDGVADAVNCPFRNDKCVFLISIATSLTVNHIIRKDSIVQAAI
ncbi:MAG: GNAT family N-acetyltransferase [Candidatus Moraniibacteriota bacterium]|jgi:GNAT superfamily N-acetyltransferase